MLKSLVNAIRRQFWGLSDLIDEQPPTKSYSSVKEFLSDVRRLSLLATRGIVFVLIIVSLPVAVYLATSSQSPLQQGRAATPTTTPIVITLPSPQVASPSAKPRLPHTK